MSSLKAFKDGNFSAKVFSLTKYDSTLLTTVHHGPNRQLIEVGAAKLVTRYFEHLVDAKARANPSSLHHVYEFDKVGEKNARLFNSKLTPTSKGVVISFNFKKTKFPNREGYMFYQKAQVMEDGKTVIIKPKRAKSLRYTLSDGRIVVTKKPSVVTNPGGDEVKGSFNSEFSRFTVYQANRVLKEFKYFERVNANIENKRRRIIPQINTAPLTNYAQRAIIDSGKIATEAALSVS